MSNKSNTPTLFVDLPKTAGGAISTLASMKGQASSGALYMVHNHPTFADACMVAFGIAKKKKASVRDAMLSVWHDTPEGAYHVASKQEVMLTPAKSRTQAQRDTLSAAKTLENAINIQAQRLADAYRGTRILNDAGFRVSLTEISGSRTWVCYFRNEKGANELDNQKLTADGLIQIANLKVHGITNKTTAVDVLAKLTGKKRKANKAKGNATNEMQELVNSKTGDVLAAIDTRLAALCDSEKHLIDGVSKATRDAAYRVYARLHRTLSDEAKAEALAAFDADAAKETPKPRRTRRAAAAAVAA